MKCFPTQGGPKRPQTFVYLNQHTGSSFLQPQFAWVRQNCMSHWNPVCYQFHHPFFTYSYLGMTHSVNLNAYVISEISRVQAWLNLGDRRKHHSKAALESRTWLSFSSTAWEKQQLSKYLFWVYPEKGGHAHMGKERQRLKRRRGGWILPGEGCCRDTSAG